MQDDWELGQRILYWEVMRKILLKTEDLPTAGSLNSKEIANEGVGSNTVAYNIVLLFDYGLIDGILKRGSSGSLWCEAIRLTSNGLRFLNIIRDDNIWAKIKEKARERNLVEPSMLDITTLKITVDQLLKK